MDGRSLQRGADKEDLRMAAANQDLLAGQHEPDPLMEHGQQMWREHAARIHVFHEWGQDPSGAPISPKGISPQALCFACAWNYGLLELFGIPSGYEGKGAEASSLLLASYLSGTTGLTNSSLKAVRVLDGANKWGRRTLQLWPLLSTLGLAHETTTRL